jgi:uncharacterized NAD-dependent epimerase/dehydratase family protein
MKKEKAIVVTNGFLGKLQAKTCHGLLRGTERFEILAVIDDSQPGKDAGEVMDGKTLGIQVYESIQSYLDANNGVPTYCVVGVAVEGGILPDHFRNTLYFAMEKGMSIVCGLHSILSEDEAFAERAQQFGVDLIDVRKPRPYHQLHFWTGKIYNVEVPRIAVLGIDCAVGKRTTCRWIMETCNANNIKTEMIYTGQTGWLQGSKYGFIFDSTLNDFIGGEIEHAIVTCAEEVKPDLIVVEGQSALRNPSGPCGSEFILSGDIKHVVLQHAPGRTYFDDDEKLGIPLPSIESEIELIRMYGAEVIAVTLSEEGLNEIDMQHFKRELEIKTNIPVIRPLKEGLDALIPLIEQIC